MTLADPAPAGAGGGRRRALPASVVRITADGGATAGTGFLVAADTVVTCAHVVRAAGGEPGGRVRLAFPHLPGAPRPEGHVLPGGWRAPEAQDIAVLRLESTPAGAEPVALGSAEDGRGHRVSSFGFPVQAPEGGHFGYGTAGDLLPAGEAGTLLQLADANDLTTGFSGGPVLDETTGLVIGMVTAITGPDRHSRGVGIAYATPARQLREVLPELSEHQVCPYRGLEPFTAEHAGWFHGRDAAVEEVLAELGGQRRAVLLLGPSGAGKSSLLQAGVLPALAEGRLPGSDRWLPVLARPGQDLPAELEQAGLPGAASEGFLSAAERRLAGEPAGRRLLLVVDQFEELLAQPTRDAARDGDGGGDREGDGDERLAAAERQLVELIGSPVPVSLVLVMRDDFYPRLAARAPELLKALTPGLLNVPATLSAADLRAIVTAPAEAVGLRLEDGLPERIVTDVLAAGPSAAGQAPVTLLPPLELALSQLWERREDGRLTHRAYDRIGEVDGSLATWCDTAMGRLPAEHRPMARRVLTALVRPADDTHAVPATRRHVPLADLRALATGPLAAPPDGQEADQAFDAVLAALTRHRIVTTRTTPRPDGTPGRATAELVHDALVRDWAELRDWVAEDRDFHAWLHRAEERQARHTASGHPGDLLDGTDLTEGLTWSTRRGLPGATREFLSASARRQGRLRRLRNTAVTALAFLLVVAVTTAGVALWQRGEALRHARESAARAMMTRAEALRDSDPRLALQLGVAAHRLDPDAPATRASLLETLTTSRHTATVDGLGAELTAVALSPDGRMLAAGTNDGLLRFWDVSEPERPEPAGTAEVSSEGSGVTALAWRPDGKVLITGDDKELGLWKTGDRSRPEQIGQVPGFGAPLTSAVWTGDGRRVAVANYHNTYLLDMGAADAGRVPREVTVRAKIPHGGDPSHDRENTRLALSPDGSLLVTSDGRDSVQLWDADGPEPVKSGSPLPLTRESAGSSVISAALSPDGRTLALGTLASEVEVWDVEDPRDPRRLHSSLNVGLFMPVDRVSFTGDPRVLACAGHDGTVQLVSLSPSMPRRTDMPLVHGAPVTSLSAATGRRLLATGGTDGRVLLWDTGDRDRPRRLRAPLPGHASGSTDGTLTLGGGLLASSAPDGRVLLWDVRRPKRPRGLPPVDYSQPGSGPWGSNPPYASALSPDGRRLATAGGPDGRGVALWRAEGGSFRPAGSPLKGHRGTPTAFAWSRDGSLLATGDDRGRILLRDASDPDGTAREAESAHGGAVRMVAFDATGRRLITAGTDGRALLWRIPEAGGRLSRIGEVSTGQIGAGRSSAAVSADGGLLAVGHSSAALSLWDVSDPGRPRRLARTGVGHNGAVAAVALSPDGSLLASSSIGDDAVLLWDIRDRSRPRRIGSALYGDTPFPVSLAFLPDGRTLASQTVTQLDLWDLSGALEVRADPLSTACERLGGAGLGRAEWETYAGGTEYRRTCD
ncbi:trypsin-like peptidase domain-containing protein [Streptomyces nanhaiensis]|uniref:nSTAND1 domain-containing NTPase n=1 Tax=Streptomyces nanhaiensis TaxID=679319 RepID=UPI00399D26C8